MAISRYDTPAQLQLMNTYVPLPYQELMAGLQAKEKQQAAALAGVAKIGDLETQALNLGNLPEGTDYERVLKVQKEIDDKIDALSSGMDLTTPEGKRAERDLYKYARKVYGQSGIMTAAQASYNARVKLQDEYNKALLKGKPFRAEQVQRAMEFFDKYYHEHGGIGETTTGQAYKQWKGTEYLAADVNLTDWAMKHADKIKADLKAVRRPTRDNEGYILTHETSGKAITPQDIARTLLGPNYEQVLQGDVSKIGGLAGGDRELLENLIQGEKMGYSSFGELINATMGAIDAFSFQETKDFLDMKTDQGYWNRLKEFGDVGDIDISQTSLFAQGVTNADNREKLEENPGNYLRNKINTRNKVIGTINRNLEKAQNLLATTTDPEQRQLIESDVQEMREAKRDQEALLQKEMEQNTGILLGVTKSLYDEAVKLGEIDPNQYSAADVAQVAMLNYLPKNNDPTRNPINQVFGFTSGQTGEQLNEQIESVFGESNLSLEAINDLHDKLQNTVQSLTGNVKENWTRGMSEGTEEVPTYDATYGSNLGYYLDDKFTSSAITTLTQDSRNYVGVGINDSLLSKNTGFKREQDNMKRNPNQYSFYEHTDGNQVKLKTDKNIEGLVDKAEIVKVFNTENGPVMEIRVPESVVKEYTSVKGELDVTGFDPLGKALMGEGEGKVTQSVSSSGTVYSHLFVRPKNSKDTYL